MIRNKQVDFIPMALKLGDMEAKTVPTRSIKVRVDMRLSCHECAERQHLL